MRDFRAYDLGDPATDAILEELRERWRHERHLHGDHEQRIQDRPDLDNYRMRCNECHAAKTLREQNGTYQPPAPV